MIAKIEIRDVSSAFAMEQIKYTTELPLDYMMLEQAKSMED
jgi:Lrp/AsnC family transcriptional regulator